MKSFSSFLLIIINNYLILGFENDEIVDSFPFDKNLMVLTDETFEKAIEKYENIFAIFYAPWCGHCKKVLPILEKISMILSQENIIVAKVDATKEKKIANKNKIGSYPTLKFFKDNTSVKYSGQRKEKNLIEWARKIAAPHVTFLKKMEEIEKMKNENSVCIIYFGKEEKDIKIMKKLAIKFDEFSFAIVKDERLAQMYKAVFNSVILLKNFDEKRNDIINFDEKKLETFIKKYSEKKILSFTEKNINLIFNKHKPALVYFGRKWDLNWKRDVPTLEKLAYNIDNDLIIITTEVKEGFGKSIAEKIKLRNNEIPCIMILEVNINIDKYLYTGNYEYNDLVKFVQNWEKGLVNKYLRSQKEPRHNKGNVYILVGDTFKRQVLENDDDVMVLFYNPVNNDNLRMEKVYEEVAQKLISQNPDLVLAKIDMSENEIDAFIIHDYPTIKFFPGNKKYNAPFEYKGAKKVKDMIDFIKKHAFHKVKYDEELVTDL